MASVSIPSANNTAKGLILVDRVKLKRLIKALISGKIVCSGISDVAIASIHSKKTLDYDNYYYEKNRKKQRFLAGA